MMKTRQPICLLLWIWICLPVTQLHAQVAQWGYVTPMIQKLSHAGILLTPQEIQVAALVKDGKTTAEIADIMFISEATVSFHRKNLRSKLGLKNKQANLRSYLMTMS